MKPSYKMALILEILRDKRCRLTEEYLQTLSEYQLVEILSDLNWQLREDI